MIRWSGGQTTPHHLPPLYRVHTDVDESFPRVTQARVQGPGGICLKTYLDLFPRWIGFVSDLSTAILERRPTMQCWSAPWTTWEEEEEEENDGEKRRKRMRWRRIIGRRRRIMGSRSETSGG